MLRCSRRSMGTVRRKEIFDPPGLVGVQRRMLVIDHLRSPVRVLNKCEDRDFDPTQCND